MRGIGELGIVAYARSLRARVLHSILLSLERSDPAAVPRNFQFFLHFSYIFNHTRCKANIMSYLLPHPIPGVRVRAFVLVLH